MSSELIHFGAYVGCGLLAYIATFWFLRRRGVEKEELNRFIYGWLSFEVLLLGAFLWPLFLVASVLILIGDLQVKKARKRRVLEKEEEAKRKTRYSDMSLDEMLAEQRQVIYELRKGESDRKA